MRTAFRDRRFTSTSSRRPRSTSRARHCSPTRAGTSASACGGAIRARERGSRRAFIDLAIAGRGRKCCETSGIRTRVSASWGSGSRDRAVGGTR
jgi:hypothetical protein